MACLRASLTKSARTVLKYSLGLSEADQVKSPCVIQWQDYALGVAITINSPDNNFVQLCVRNATNVVEYDILREFAEG